MIEHKYTFIQKLVQEAEYYQNPDHIEQLVQSGKICHVSPQPLSMAFKKLPPERVSQWLPALSSEQRIVLLDMDLWHRDHLNVADFAYWIKAYEKTSSLELQAEFVKSDQFTLFFKGIMNISTFDEEDPSYPDHKNFFLTDDHLLLIEYDEHFPYVDELKNLLRVFYSEYGMENAYTHLFKIVVDSFLAFQEEQYHLKKERLRDYGMIDYYDAIDFLAPLATMAQLDSFIGTKKKSQGKIDAVIKNQILSKNTILPYQKKLDAIHEELSKVKDRERIDFLQFNFIRLVNATLSLDDSLRKGSVSVTQTSSETRYYLLLGLEYIHSKRQFNEDSLFETFDFFDLYRVGKSMIRIQTTHLKQVLKRHGFSDQKDQLFLGAYFKNFLEDSFARPPRKVLDIKTFHSWTEEVQCLLDFLPFIARFQKTYMDISSGGKIKDKKFINYSLEDIDFEALILSHLINFALGHYQSPDRSPKIGLTISEVREFTQKHFHQYLNSTKPFLETFGLQEVRGGHSYLSSIMQENLEGYDFSKMTEEDFAHVGGVLIFSPL